MGGTAEGAGRWPRTCPAQCRATTPAAGFTGGTGGQRGEGEESGGRFCSYALLSSLQEQIRRDWVAVPTSTHVLDRSALLQPSVPTNKRSTCFTEGLSVPGLSAWVPLLEALPLPGWVTLNTTFPCLHSA